MALRFLPSDLRGDVGLRDSPPADSPSPTSQGGSSNGAKAGVARKLKEVDDLLAKLQKEGVEIDGKIASIIDDGIAKIKAEALREKINEQKGIKKAVLIGKVLLVTVASLAIGFVMGVDWLENAIRKELAKRKRFS